MASVLFLACTREAVCDVVADALTNFNDHVEITFAEAPDKGNPLKDFPLLVRLSEGAPAGFTYARVDPYGADIRFVFVEGSESNTVPYEVDSWNTNGVSALWVRVPRFSEKSDLKLVMYWAPDDPDKLPANEPSAVWSGYTGVWHMNDAVDSATNGIASTQGAKAQVYEGRIGSALGTRDSGPNGPILQIPSGTSVDRLTEGAYTISAWLKPNLISGGPWFYSARAASTDDAFGAELVEASGSVKLRLHANGEQTYNPTKTFAKGEWTHLAVVHSASNAVHRFYLNGMGPYESAKQADKPGAGGFAFGGLVGAGAEGTLNGDLDEIRIYPGNLEPSWITNEYAQVVSSDFVSFGAVFSTGKPVYVEEEEEEEPEVDPTPQPSGDVSTADYAGKAVLTPAAGSVAEGTVLTNFAMLVKVWEGEPSGFDPKKLPFGSEDVRFFDEEGRVLDFEIDTWNALGVSAFWVKVPYLSPSSRITMCWGLKEGKTLPDVDPTAVWSDYAGVWHLSDETDSTTNRAEAAFGPNAATTSDGAVGKAAGTKLTGQNGAILDITLNAAIDALASGTFTVSGWMSLNKSSLRYGALFSRAAADDPAWGARFCGGTTGDSSALAMETGGAGWTNAVIVEEKTWTRFDLVYSGDRLAFYLNGVKKAESSAERSILNGSSGRLAIGGLVAAAGETLGEGTFNGDIDEFRLRRGVQPDAVRAAEADQGRYDDFYTREPASWESGAALQNRWRVLPTASKTTWTEGDEAASFTLGEPWYGTSEMTFQDRASGEPLAEMPTEAGDYRAVFSVERTETASGIFSALTYAIDFRIRRYRPTHDLGDGNGRILLLNADESVSDGKVCAQAYSETARGQGRPFWWHDVDTGFDYTSTSLDFNFCGGLRHTYYAADGETRLWDLIDVRFGNTYNNADEVLRRTGDWEEWETGLEPGLNYLSWNPDGGCLVDFMGAKAEGWHEYAAQAVMCNTFRASINSTLFTNGIGTIYFDCVNSHTDDATNGYYKLVVEMATNAVDRATGAPAGLPTDEAIASTYSRYDENGNVIATYVDDAYEFADWKPLTMRVKVVNGSEMTDLDPTDELTLSLAGGGSYTNFYRVYVPVDCLATARFRIRRTAINPDYTILTDAHSLILVDNVICSVPTDRLALEPHGIYDTSKTERETVGYEGAFTPSYPSVTDTDIRPRAKATTLSGRPLEAGMLSAVTMHYRWRYLNQQDSEWATVDLDPATLVGLEALVWPRSSGDLEYWYEANQASEFYEYVDYSGLNLKLDGYSEEVTSVTNRAPDYATAGDWFTRVRDGKSTYGAVKLHVRRGSETAPVETIDLFVARDRIWRGCLQTTNALEGGIYFRLEGRNRQDDATLGDFLYNTNIWYLADAVEKLPHSGTVVAGSTNSWGRVPCDGATGHVLFQLDESTRAITVVHADWQDFNGWNDAHRDYFTGASVDDATKSGVSANAREYLCYSNGWTDDCATNVWWTERFSPSFLSGREFYSPFTEADTPNGFAAGYGQWVPSAYAVVRKVDDHYEQALQLAGQGQGYVQMTDPVVSPRGVESVRFNARIAQYVTPDDFAYYDGSTTLKDYTFLTRAAFDLAGNSNFTGNASLSLAAFMRPGKSCYEARWEQIDGNIQNGTGKILGPAPRGQRLALYRWNRDNGEWKATALLAATNTTSVQSWGRNAPQAIPAAFSITNGLMPFMIGAYNNESAGYTVIVAAIHIPGVADAAKNVKGNHADTDVATLANESGWLYVVYRDTSADRLVRGTYGALAASCEGVFVRPQYHTGIVSWDTQANTRKLTSQVRPNPSATTALGAKFYNSATVRECVDDFADDLWADQEGRMEMFWTTLSDNRNGLSAAVVTQTVDVYTAPLGTTSWTKSPVASRTLTGFGRPGVLQDTVFDFWTTDELSVRIQPGGEWDRGVRTDVIVDNIQVSQWRGQDWLGSNATERNQGGRTNFVYTSGWITNGVLELSPRRTPDGSPCSLRTPLCDGETEKGVTRGLGLGSIRIHYCDAQSNACLLVQVATNGVGTLNLRSITLDPGTDLLTWTTVTNWSFTNMTAEARKDGYLYCSPGLHGVVGTMRVIVDPALRDQVKDATDPTAFGSVGIVSADFYDEPPLDKGCWWGFNIRTIGDAADTERRMYLPDNPLKSASPDPIAEIGRSLALNNSITEDCDPELVAKVPNPFKAHMPFVQTPTFTSNIVGEVSFRARKYSGEKGSQPAEIQLYGTTATDLSKLTDEDWDKLWRFTVSNTTYETFRYKTDTTAGYRAFRLAVTGVKGVDAESRGPDPKSGSNPVRVLLDDILVSEAVRARLAFRNVGAFRHSITGTTYVANVPSVSEQPICQEAWGVQAEIYSAMLGEEVDESFVPKVRLHYYKGSNPWGYSQWKSQATSAWLTRATDTNGVYRSSSIDSPGAVIPMADSAEVVQYMLEVVYKVVNSETGRKMYATNWLESADWSVPSWYYPVDYNVSYGGGLESKFSAFAIIEPIAPGWAWINEINLFGEFKSYVNSDTKKQFVEVVKPVEYDLNGWSLRMLAAKTYGTSRTSFVTNDVAVFGRNVASQKAGTVKCGHMSFIVVGNPTTSLTGEQYDGFWNFTTIDGKTFESGGVLGSYYPVAVQLVRPTGIIEHEVAILGTNIYESVLTAVAWQYSSTNLAQQIRNVSAQSTAFAVPDDRTSAATSVGIFGEDAARAKSALCWNSTMTMTPGDLNENQTISPDYPRPGGETILVFAYVDTLFGRIDQTVGTATNTTEMQTIALTRGNKGGLDIKYTVRPWCELGPVEETEGGQKRIPIVTTNALRQYTVNVAKGATDNVTVIASAQVDSNLRKFGLDEYNRYTPAVLSWLEGGKTLNGEFYDAESGQIHLAQFLALSGQVVTNMTLTQMYWLDMDPTASNMFFRAGMVKPPSPVVWEDPAYDPERDPQAYTNLRLGVYMSISNGNGRARRKGASVWAPYVLRGLGPGELSWNYSPSAASAGAWTSETFKVTGYLNTGLTTPSDETAWVPLRYFVFDENSFDANFESEIDILDPFSTSSPAYAAGWYRWVQEHEGVRPSVFLGWNIDERLKPITAEILAPTNRLDGTAEP